MSTCSVHLHVDFLDVWYPHVEPPALGSSQTCLILCLRPTQVQRGVRPKLSTPVAALEVSYIRLQCDVEHLCHCVHVTGYHVGYTWPRNIFIHVCTWLEWPAWPRVLVYPCIQGCKVSIWYHYTVPIWACHVPYDVCCPHVLDGVKPIRRVVGRNLAKAYS